MVFCCLPGKISLRIPGMSRVSLQLSDSPESLFFYRIAKLLQSVPKTF